MDELYAGAGANVFFVWIELKLWGWDMNDISNSIFVTGTRGRCQSFVLLCGGGGGSTSIVEMRNSWLISGPIRSD